MRGTHVDAILRSDSIASSLLAASPVPCFVVDQAARIVQWNDALSAASGYEGELAGMEVSRLLGGDDVSSALTAPERWDGSGPIQVRCDLRRRDGTLAPFELSGAAVCDEEGTVVGLSCMGRDLSERPEAPARPVTSRTEEELRANAVRLEALVENLHAGILVEDEERRIAFTNHLFCDLFGIGVPPEALVGTDCAVAARQVAPLFADTEALARIDAIVEAGELVLSEEVEMADGRVLERDFIPVSIDGAAGGYMWQYRDSTERKKAEIALRDREELLAAVADAMGHLLTEELQEAVTYAFSRLGRATRSDRVYLFETHRDLASGTVLISQRYEWNGDSATPQIDNPDLQNVPFDAVYARWHRVLGERGVIAGPVREMPDDERPLLEAQDIRSLLVVPIHIEDELWGFIGFDDCREERIWSEAEQATLTAAAGAIGKTISQQRDRQALAESEEKYRSVVEDVRDVVFQLDRQGRWSFLNPAWTEVTGFPVAESLGRDYLEYVHPDDREMMRQLSRPLVAGERDVSRQEVRLRKRDGGFRWIEVSARRTHDEHGTVMGASGTLHDVTERLEAISALERAVERERELGQLKSRFVSMASHELRTPLTAMRSSAELLNEFGGAWDGERRETLLERILSNAQVMNALIEDVLLLGRVESGRLAFTPEVIEIGAFCCELVREFEQGEGSAHQIRLDLPETPGEVEADPKLLRHILGNLLSNAVKYAPQGTQVDLAVTRTDEQVRLVVTDRGIGIPESDLGRLFEPFHRAGNAGNHSGTGLGLAIAKRAADLHGGRIGVESVPGAGTTFTVELPAISSC